MPKQLCPHCAGTGYKIDPRILAAKRIAKKLTLKDLAAKMGISFQYLSDLERGTRNWNAELLRAFNKAIA